MRLSNRLFLLPACAASVILLAACGSSAAAPASPSASASAVASAAPAKPAASAEAKPSGASAAAKPAASGTTHVVVGVTSKSTGSLYLYVGKDLGIFAKHGLDPEFVVGQSDALVAGLSKGDMEFMGTIPSAIQGAEKGLPMRVIFVAKDHPEYLLVGDKGVTEVSQLKGKQIAGSNPAQLPTLMANALLSIDGLQPSDYTIVSVQNDPARAALVENHRVAAGILGVSEALPLLNDGHPIIDSTISKVWTPSSGLATTVDLMKNRKALVQNMVDAAVEAAKVTATDRQQTVGVLEQEFGLSEADSGKLFDLLKPSYTNGGRPDPRAIQNQIETDAKAMELPKPATEDQIYDYSFLAGAAQK